MRACVALLMTLAMVSAFTAQAQEKEQIELKRIPPPRPTQPQQEEVAAPQGDKKLRWVCRQLRLNDEQMQQAEALIAVYNAELTEMQANAPELLQKIQDKFAELQKAKADGNQDEVTRLQQELREMAPGVAAENHFYDSLMGVLYEEQAERLPAIRKRAENAGDLALRPVHVLRAAMKLSLNQEQRAQLEKLLADFRQLQLNERTRTDAEAEQRVDQLVADIGNVLTAEQKAEFSKSVKELREAPPAATPIELAEPQAEKQG